MTTGPQITLPQPPDDQKRILDAGGVACWSEDVDILTYIPAEPDAFPMFFDHRVYQGSDGKVYPLPFIDRIESAPVMTAWRAIHLENRWVRLMLLPDLGGRIHIGYDKTRGYDFFYRNNVIKPALVGLGGPWISGGVEFNWPQHHRPATYLPTETSIERCDDGSVTVWHSDIDPLQRMRGTHGVRLRPHEATVEVTARLFNRTDEQHTFLWWANVAAAVHEDYQSFFPTDVRYVADHARRAITGFPQSDRPYYGVDYPYLAEQREGADRIDLYSNIPVPTSYMITDTADAFFGGYDHRAQAGFVHWADRDIAPGKKQWTWGDGSIGRAWDRALTDSDGPYVELMAGVFTDNQPDFNFLAPGETREFSQFWYPIQDVGAVHQATRTAAVSVNVADGYAQVGVASTRECEVQLIVHHNGVALYTHSGPVAPGEPIQVGFAAPGCVSRDDLVVRVSEGTDELVVWHKHESLNSEPWLASAPAQPEEITSVDELLLTAQHLTQYRHPTRSAKPYLERVLEIDPDDSRARIALAELAHTVGDYQGALRHLEVAAARITRRNLNPRSGELHYRRALSLERLQHVDEAATDFAKSAWDVSFCLAGHLGAARTLLRQGHNAEGLDHATQATTADPRNATAQALRVLALRRLDRREQSDHILRHALASDPLDPLLNAIDGSLHVVDTTTYLIVAYEFARIGEADAALLWSGRAATAGRSAFGNPAPIAHYLRAALLDEQGNHDTANIERALARTVDRQLAFPSGLDDFDVLQRALSHESSPGQRDVVALGLLGSWLLGARRGADARTVLEEAVIVGPADAVVLRNTAIAVANTSAELQTAAQYLDEAVRTAGPLPRLIFERDQLARLRGVPSAERVAKLESSGTDLLSRDDLTISYVELLLDANRTTEAMAILDGKQFQPFEGGEGQVLAAFDRASVALADTLKEPDPLAAAQFLDSGREPPANLGEGRHPAGPNAERLVVAGDAYLASGDEVRARARWSEARTAGGSLAVAARPARLDDYWVGIAHTRLGEWSRALAVWESLENTAAALAESAFTPDYFATSLPQMLLFSVDDVRGRQAMVENLQRAAADGRAISGAARNAATANTPAKGTIT
jgi:tetratricopeptide (TPR) repeat protein